jgi:hypothetical protein
LSPMPSHEQAGRTATLESAISAARLRTFIMAVSSVRAFASLN